MSRLILPLPPSVNHYWLTCGKRKFLSAAAREWHREAAVRTYIWKTFHHWQTADRKLVVRIWIWWANKRRRDSDNLLKPVLDILQNCGIVADDCYCLPQVMDYAIDKKKPRVEIELEVMA